MAQVQNPAYNRPIFEPRGESRGVLLLRIKSQEQAEVSKRDLNKASTVTTVVLAIRLVVHLLVLVHLLVDCTNEGVVIEIVRILLAVAD